MLTVPRSKENYYALVGLKCGMCSIWNEDISEPRFKRELSQLFSLCVSFVWNVQLELSQLYSKSTPINDLWWAGYSCHCRNLWNAKVCSLFNYWCKFVLCHIGIYSYVVDLAYVIFVIGIVLLIIQLVSCMKILYISLAFGWNLWSCCASIILRIFILLLEGLCKEIVVLLLYRYQIRNN